LSENGFIGESETGKVYEQSVRLTLEGEEIEIRQIIVELNKKPVMAMKSYIYSPICHAIKQMRSKLPTYIVNAGQLKLLFKN